MVQRTRKTKGQPQESLTSPGVAARRAGWVLLVALLLAVSAGVVWLGTKFASHDPTEDNANAGFVRKTDENAEVFLAKRTAWQQIDNPSSDGWDTEALVQQADKQLKNLGKMLIHAELVDPRQLKSLVTADFSCGPLLPEGLQRVFEDQVFVVERSDTNVTSPVSFHAASGLREAIRQATVDFQDATNPRFKFKVIHVELTQDGFTTRQYLSLSGVTENGVAEQHATWLVHWNTGGDGELPMIRKIAVKTSSGCLPGMRPDPCLRTVPKRHSRGIPATRTNCCAARTTGWNGLLFVACSPGTAWRESPPEM